MLDKLRSSSTSFARSPNVAEGTILQMKNQGVGTHKTPSAFGQVYTHTYWDFTKYGGFLPYNPTPR